MRTPIVGALVLVLASAAWCQETGTALLNQLPLPPGNLCDPAPALEEAFHERLGLVGRQIGEALAKRNKQQRAYVEEHQDEWREEMVKQSGLTPEQVAKIKAAKGNRKAAAALKRELAEQALQQYADLTIDEGRSLKNMSEEEKAGWREAYATQQIATAQANAQSRTPEEQAEEEKKRERLAKMARLAEDQKRLMEQVGAVREVIWQKMRKLDSDAQGFREESLVPIEKRLAAVREEVLQLSEDMRRESEQFHLDRPLTDAEAHAYGELQKRYEAKFSELYRKREGIEKEKTKMLQVYCSQFSPVYGGLIREYLDWAKGAQPDFARYEEMENERFALQMNASNMQPSVVPGTLGLQEAKACVDLLGSADKYAREYRDRQNKPSDEAASGAE